MARRKICVVTGSRAEYGLLFWLMKEVEADPDLDLQLIVTGAHLEDRFGHTADVIEEDGFTIDERVAMNLADDSPVGIAVSMGRCLGGMAKAFDRLQPDVAVVLGDRYEILAAAEAAMLVRVPLAHIHGGELSEGAMDDAMRHAISKFSQLHFVAAEDYRRRVIQLGEDPERVFIVGAAGLDNIEKLDLLSREELEHSLGHELEGDFFLITYHPVTLDERAGVAGVDGMLAALDEFPDHAILFTGVNADPERERITERIRNYAAQRPSRVYVHESLGQRRYLSAVQHSSAVIGNSSSGLIEAPALGVPTVNIGDRQRGRLKAPSVIDCCDDAAGIADAILGAISPDFRKSYEGAPSPYGAPGASLKIKNILKEYPLQHILEKRFCDMRQMA